MATVEYRGMGWHPDLTDCRDLSCKKPDIESIFQKSYVMRSLSSDVLPPAVDLRPFCSPIEDQGNIGSCTANAAVGLMEYYERRALGRHFDASRLFIYKATRKLLGWKGDTGAYLRDTMKAMVLFGAPPERYWPYVEAKYEDEPDAFCYSFASNFQALKYFRLDPPGMAPKDVLLNVKKRLAAGLPCMFGFSVYSSMPGVNSGNSHIPYPTSADRLSGGHAVIAVGYDDAEGSLLIRNSWGANWGDAGYGWLPYAYVETELAEDFWSLIKLEYVDTDLFK